MSCEKSQPQAARADQKSPLKNGDGPPRSALKSSLRVKVKDLEETKQKVNSIKSPARVFINIDEGASCGGKKIDEKLLPSSRDIQEVFKLGSQEPISTG